MDSCPRRSTDAAIHLDLVFSYLQIEGIEISGFKFEIRSKSRGKADLLD